MPAPPPTTTYLRYVSSGTVLRDHELLPIWNQFNANPPDTYSTEKINTEATIVDSVPLALPEYKYQLIVWEKIPGKNQAWYDSVYGTCPYSTIGDE